MSLPIRSAYEVLFGDRLLVQFLIEYRDEQYMALAVGEFRWHNENAGYQSQRRDRELSCG